MLKKLWSIFPLYEIFLLVISFLAFYGAISLLSPDYMENDLYLDNNWLKTNAEFIIHERSR